MSENTNKPTLDTAIVQRMNELNELVQKDVAWMEAQADLNDYSHHVSNLEANLQIHLGKMQAFREQVVRQIATKCGDAGADVYGSELTNIRIRNFFSKIAGMFCRKFDS